MQSSLFEAEASTERQPLHIAYGAGVDSTAMLVAMYERGIRPDVILFADVGAEKPETYAYLPIINAWLRKVGFPELTIVKYAPQSAPYTTLEEKCLANGTLPSLAYGQHSCSLVFKVQPQNKFLRTWKPAVDAWARGQKVIRALGYDNGAQDCRRRAKADRSVASAMEPKPVYVGKGKDRKPKLDKHGQPVMRVNKMADGFLFEYWYPLQEWGIDRIECLRLIAQAGLPLPLKSACWFCPASKKSEIVWLRDTHPVLFHRALKMEAGAMGGAHNLKRIADGKNISTKGLGRTFAWSDLATVKAEELEGDDAAILQP